MVQAANSVEMLARNNCASILRAYQSRPSTPPLSVSGVVADHLSPLDRPFKCKDCARKFDTFQALGGHRASHMKHSFSPNQQSRQQIGNPGGQFTFGDLLVAHRPPRFKVHDCKLCRERFPTGQALGGHMRKHADFGRAKRKRAAEVLDASDTFPMESNKRMVLQFDLNFPPPVDEFILQIA